MNATTEHKNLSNSFDPAQYASRVPRDVDPPRSPAPDQARPYRPLATSITDTTLDTKIETATDDSSQPLEPETAGPALARGAYHVLSLLMPYIDAVSRNHLHSLVAPYRH